MANSAGDSSGEFTAVAGGLQSGAPAAPAALQVTGLPAGRVPGRILVVDDNIDAAELLAEIVSSLGYDTRVAYDGPSALRLVEGFVPDVALLDIGLPFMDGHELGARLAELPALKNTKLVALTGYGQDVDRDRSTQSGFVLHIVKPADLDALEGTLAQLTLPHDA
jgi:CheY-like chemotaxis protein